MYHFIFYFIYRGKLKADGPEVTRFTGSLIVTIFLVVHASLLFSITRFIMCYFWQISIARANAHATSNDTYVYILFAVVAFSITKRYFNEKKINKILDKYKEVDFFYTGLNIIKFVLLLIVPFLIGIFFENKSVIYCN